jgi:U4/U6 small nuclear ribonucleoprotein PRP31
VLVLGAKRRHLAGLSSTAAQPHQGVVYQSPVVQGAPPALRIKTAKLVSAKAALLARVDAYGEDPSGAVSLVVCCCCFGGLHCGVGAKS